MGELARQKNGDLPIDAQRQKRAHMSHKGNEGPDQTAHLRSLVWAYVARSQN